MKKFRHLHVPDHWEQYWSRYPQGYTILEALINWVGQVDDMVDNQNALNKTVEDFGKELDEFVEAFDPKLQEKVIDTLYDWQQSGFLDVVIDQALQTQIDDVSEQLAQIGLQVGKKQTGENYDTQRIQRAINIVSMLGGGNVFLPVGKYNPDPNNSIKIPSNISLKGSEGATIIESSGETRTQPVFELEGNNITIEGLNINLKGDGTLTTLPQTQTAFSLKKTSERIYIRKNHVKNAYAGVLVNPLDNNTIRHIFIENNVFERLNHNVQLGLAVTSGEPNNLIEYVNITGNVMKDGFKESDGVKTAQNCRKIIISSNHITNMERDGLDLFTSGDEVVITDNILENNLLNGIDIKQYVTQYPTTRNGYNKSMVIANNIINDNKDHGVSINQVSGEQQINYLISVDGNTITGNGRSGIWCMGKNINITNNLVYQNLQKTDLPLNDMKGAITLQGTTDQWCRYINVTGNQVLNNGYSAILGVGILLDNFVEAVNIKDNMVVNDVTLENAFQKTGLIIKTLNSEDIVVKDNRIRGHLKNVKIRNESKVIGEKFSLFIPNEQASNYDFISVFKADSPLTILGAKIILGNSVPVDESNYLNINIFKRVGGTGTNLITHTTRTTPITAWETINLQSFPFNDPSNIDGDDKKEVNENELIGFRIVGVGTGRSLSNFSLELDYIAC